MTAWAAAWEWLTREHWRIGGGLTRLLLGAWALYFYALHASVRHTLWGPDGLWPFHRFVADQPFLSVYALSGSPVVFDVLYAAAVLVALAYTLGWWTRVAGALHWLMVWSLQERNPFITDGGDNIMRIVLLFLAAANVGALFSLDALRPRWRLPRWARESLAVAHNVAILLVLAQLCIVYLSTGLYKAMGEVWQNGTALYYILRVQEFSAPGLAELVYRNPYLVVLGTYGTVLFEVLFPAALIHPWTRAGMAVAGVGFHVAIAVLMGLVTFAWSMLSLYPLLFADRQYLSAARRLQTAWRLTIFYDGWCPTCARSVAWLRAADLLGVFSFVSFRDPGVVEACGLDPDRLERRIQAADARGRLTEGMATLAALAARSPLLWPLWPFCLVGRLLFGQRLYDAAARRRLVVVPAPCGPVCPAPRAGTTPTDRRW